MNTVDAIRLFGTVRELAKALEITEQAIYQWGEKVPALRAYQIREKLQKRGRKNG